MVDVVYLVKPTDSNEELKHSLRSLVAHFPHDRVVLVGHLPRWARHVVALQTIQKGTKYENSTGNVLTACESGQVSPDWVLFNDDFFALKPVSDPMAVYNRGPAWKVAEEYEQRYGGRSVYWKGMVATLDLLKSWGFTDPLSFELHRPMPINSDVMAEALRRASDSGIDVLHKRTLYGNVAGLVGETVRDVKMHGRNGRRMAGWRTGAWLSTDDSAFRGAVGAFVKGMFPSPCRYEEGWDGRPNAVSQVAADPPAHSGAGRLHLSRPRPAA